MALLTTLQLKVQQLGEQHAATAATLVSIGAAYMQLGMYDPHIQSTHSCPTL